MKDLRRGEVAENPRAILILAVLISRIYVLVQSECKVIWFVGHLGRGRVLGPNRTLGAWSRALIHPPPPATSLTPVPRSPLSASHPQPSLPVTCPPQPPPTSSPYLSPLYISKRGRKQAGRAARAPGDPLSLSPFQLLPLATGPISLPILICL